MRITDHVLRIPGGFEIQLTHVDMPLIHVLYLVHRHRRCLLERELSKAGKQEAVVFCCFDTVQALEQHAADHS